MFNSSSYCCVYEVKLPTSQSDPSTKWTVLASHAAIPAVKYCGYFDGYIAFLDGLDEGNHQIALYHAASSTTISWNVDPPNIDNVSLHIVIFFSNLTSLH